VPDPVDHPVEHPVALPPTQETKHYDKYEKLIELEQQLQCLAEETPPPSLSNINLKLDSMANLVNPSPLLDSAASRGTEVQAFQTDSEEGQREEYTNQSPLLGRGGGEQREGQFQQDYQNTEDRFLMMAKQSVQSYNTADFTKFSLGDLSQSQ